MTQDDRRKRLYIFSPDLTLHPNDFQFVNESEALINGVRAGRYEHPIPGYGAPFCTGLPLLREKPRLRIGMLDEDDDSDPPPHELLDAYGFGPHFISGRAKALLSEIDGEGFDFLECDTTDPDGAPVTPYWMMNAIRVVEFDRERSSFEHFPQTTYPTPSVVALNDIYLPRDFPDAYHAFFFSTYQIAFIIDDVIAGAWKQARLTGARFTPLQQPSEEELGAHKQHPDFLTFMNYPYWNPKP
jgi:hypothetical protein